MPVLTNPSSYGVNHALKVEFVLAVIESDLVSLDERVPVLMQGFEQDSFLSLKFLIALQFHFLAFYIYEQMQYD